MRAFSRKNTVNHKMVRRTPQWWNTSPLILKLYAKGPSIHFFNLPVFTFSLPTIFGWKCSSSIHFLTFCIFSLCMESFFKILVNFYNFLQKYMSIFEKKRRDFLGYFSKYFQNIYGNILQKYADLWKVIWTIQKFITRTKMLLLNSCIE